MALMRKKFRFHGLKRPKVRQDMKKENLYNLNRLIKPGTQNRTFFQQKWTAKAMTRAYHGIQIKEKQWQRMFTKMPNAVVPMSPRTLALTDGSEYAAGRGSGLEPRPSTDSVDKKPAMRKKTPYMQMVYAPSERRLDTAIFRSLFASSAFQARQFVTHGHVKVNGKGMRYPGYLLNPGDMFSVEPEVVMYATGARKDQASDYVPKNQDPTDEDEIEEVQTQAPSDGTQVRSSAADEEILSTTDQAIEDELDTEEVSDSDPAKEIKKALKSLRTRTKAILDSTKADLSSKQKQEYRAFTRTIRSTMSKATSTSPSTLEDLEAQFESMSLRAASADSQRTADEAAVPADSNEMTPEEQEILRKAQVEAAENPVDPTKAYLTPWRPRDFMSAFAVIPRYLEVQHSICSSVYLRHPVCYPGHGEVPTPFHYETAQLAFNWYLRRR